MASLPSQHPDLALLLADQTRTPIISSASPPDAPKARKEGARKQKDKKAAADTNGDKNGIPDAQPQKPTRQQRADALDDLAATALRARDAAARLGLGTVATDPDLGMTPPDHIVVTYSTGAAVINSFVDPRLEHAKRQQQQQQPQKQQRATDPTTAPSGPGQDTGPENTHQAGTSSDSVTISSSADAENNATSARGPLLVGVVAAPDAQSLPEAQRAAARLERVGQAIQQQLAAMETQTR